MNRLVLILMIVLTLIGCPGCWDQKELKTLGIVAGIGVDRTPDGKLAVSFQVINPGLVKGGGGRASGGGGGAQTAPAVSVFQGEDVTNFSAGRKNRFQSSRNFYFGHGQIVVIGQDAAKQEIHAFFDLYSRWPQFRLSQMILIAKGTAHDVLAAQIPIDRIPAIGLVSIVNSSAAATGEAIAVRTIDLFQFLISKTRAAVIPQVEAVTGEEGEKNLQLSGTAVIKKDRWIGELDNTETRGLSWVINRVKTSALNVKDQRGRVIGTLEIVESTGKFKPELRGGKILIRIQIDVQSKLSDLMVAEEWTTPDKMQELGKLGSAVIRREIWSTWKKARRLNADIYGFGEAIARKYPREWKTMEQQWDRIFPQIDLSVKVETTVTRAGELIKAPLPPP